MRKATLILTTMLLAVPAMAHGKAGLEFNTYPDTAQPGEKIQFTVMAMNEGPPSGSGRLGPRPVVGRHPLVTFRSESGRIVRVRASRTDLNGIAYGSVAFPDKGPWSTELRIGDRIEIGPEMSEPIRVGVGLTQTIPAASQTAARTKPDASFPWIWVLSLGAIGSALLVLTMRRRGRWGAA